MKCTAEVFFGDRGDGWRRVLRQYIFTQKRHEPHFHFIKPTAMNLLEITNATEKGVSTQNILKDKASITLMQIKKDAVLREHQSMTNAMLVLLSGKAVYEEKDKVEALENAMDFVRIPEHIPHKVTALQDAQLLLIQ